MISGDALPQGPGRRPPDATSLGGRALTLRRLLPAMLVLTIALPAVGVAWWHADQRASRRAVAQFAARLDMERTQREALEREITETAERLAAYRQDVRALLEVRRDQLDRIERTVRALEMERDASERIIGTYASGVPLIQGGDCLRRPGGQALTVPRGRCKGPPHPRASRLATDVR